MVTLVTTEPGVKCNNFNSTNNGGISKQSSDFFEGGGGLFVQVKQ